MWQWLIVAGAAVVVWRLCQPTGDCVIRVRRGQVSIRGRIAAGRRAEIETFIAGEFAHVPRLRIDVHYPRRGQRLRVRISGRISKGERQQIRNFFSTALS